MEAGDTPMSRRAGWRWRGVGLILVGTGVVAALSWYAFVADRKLQLYGTLVWTGEDRQAPAADQWHVELAASPDQATRVRRAALARPSGDLDAKLIITNGPNKTYRGKVVPDAGNRLIVRLHSVNGDIPQPLCVPPEECVRGIEVVVLVSVPN